MRHFAHNIGDYAAATAHLSFIEDAAYHRLLRRYYQDEKPLPIDAAECRRLAGARTKEERAAVDSVLREFFILQDDGWHQKRADAEISGYHNRADAARENGRKSAGRPKPKRNPSGYSSGSNDEPDKEPDGKQTNQLTTNHSPLTTPFLTTTPSVANSARERATQPGKARLIPSDWMPTAEQIREFQKGRPDVVGERFDQRMQDFHDWCRANAVMSHDLASTWRGFMRKTTVAHIGETAREKQIREATEASERSTW